MTTITVILAFLILSAALVLYVPPRVLAGIIKSALPVGMMILGGVLFLFKQGAIGSVVAYLGFALWRRMRGVQSLGRAGTNDQSSQTSSVRSAALEMELNHSTGEMNGLVLVGRFEGQVLDDLNEEDLHALCAEVDDDAESIALLDSYFDRRFPGWRENTETDRSAGEAGPARSGPMGEEEAYEVLGLAAGASAAEIRKAHRRLMKAAHPDSGGSTFLASKINEAKDVLLRSHS